MNLKQIGKCFRFFGKNWNEFIKKDEKISEYGSKFEVNWNKFEKNLKKILAWKNCVPNTDRVNKERIRGADFWGVHIFICKKEKAGLQISSRIGKTMKNLK